MNSKINKDHAELEFGDLFEFSSPKDELKHEARMIMYRFLSEIERISGDLPKKDMAKAIGTSASFITQLFNGDKLINLMTLAKLQRAFQINFAIEAKPWQETFELGLSVIRHQEDINYSTPSLVKGTTVRLDGFAKGAQPYQPLYAA